MRTGADGEMPGPARDPQRPARGVASIEIPVSIKRGLDADRSWIVLAEWNEPRQWSIPRESGEN